MHAPLVQRLAAEFVGTAMLVTFGAGSVVAALSFGGGELTYPGLGFVALAFAIVIAVVVYGFGPVSGAHINPAVTIALALTRRFAWADVVPYLLAQLVGAAAGGFGIVAMFGVGTAEAGGVGGTALAEHVSYGSGITAEALGTFILVFAVMALAVDARAPQGWAGLMIGLAVACAILLIGPLTGGSLNPARTFGPYLVATVFGGPVSWADFALYCVGPLLGAALAAAAYDLIAAPAKALATASPSPETQLTQGEESR